MGNKYCKVLFGSVSGADSDVNYKIGEINEATNWNPNATNARDMGGFNFSNEENIFRWLVRGDTIYDVEIPEGADVLSLDSPSTPGGVFRTNKIILTNPRVVTDELAMELYNKSFFPEKTYYKALAGAAIRGHYNTCLQIIKDKVNKENIDLVLSEVFDFVKPENSNGCGNVECYKQVMRLLFEIKNDLLISRFISKEPFIKKLTDDKIINLTGESGSGKSTYAMKFIEDDNYIVIDTDLIFGERPTDNKYCLELREVFKGKSNDLLISNFDQCYLDILDYFKDSDKTIVIDSAQFRNIKNVDLLKGEVIVVRTAIETCYERCIDRYLSITSDATNEEIEKYKKKKLGMFEWYHSINHFLIKVALLGDSIKFIFDNEVNNEEELKNYLEENAIRLPEFRTAVIALIIDKDGRLLLQRRGLKSRDEQFMLEDIGGAVEKEDGNFRNALMRELAEEAGDKAKFKVLEFTGAFLVNKFDTRSDKYVNWLFLNYLCLYDSGELEINEPGKCLGYELYKYDELPREEIALTSLYFWDFYKNKKH